MFGQPPLTPYARVMLITLVAVYVVTAICENFLAIPVVSWVALPTQRITLLTPLQLVTHMWVTPPDPLAPLWLAINCYFLWRIMPPFEAEYGTRRTVQLSLVAALASGACGLLVGLVVPGLSAALAGPQAIVLGVAAAYVVLLPRHAEFDFFGARLKPLQMLWVLLGISVFFFLQHRSASTLAADFGAVGAGYLFARYWMQRRPPRKAAKKGSTRLRVVGRDDDDEGPKRWLN